MRHLLLFALAAAFLPAGEAPPLLSLTEPDCARSRERLALSPYGKIWNLPAVQRLRTAFPQGGPIDPAWMTLPDRIQELRLELLAVPGDADDASSTGSVWPRLACRLPPGQDPPAPAALVAQRQGEWWLLGQPGAIGLPAPTPGTATADLRAVFRTEPLIAYAEPADAERMRRILTILGLTRVEVEASQDAGGTSERIAVPGCRLPFRPVDPTALAGLPEKPMNLFAVGIDGAALVRMVHDVANAGDGGEGMQRADAALRAAVGLGLDELLAGCDGTYVLAVTPGMPMPGVTCSLPASPALDALAVRLLDLAQPGGGAQLAAQARGEAVMIPLPARSAPVVQYLRRTANRWLVGTDVMAIEAVAGSATPFPVAATWPNAERAVALAWTDTRAVAQMVTGFLPMMQQAVPQELRQTVVAVQGALIAAIPLLPPGSAVVHRDGDGLRVEGRNCTFSTLMPMAVGAGMVFPAISLVRANARKAQVSNNMRQILLASLSYGTDNDQAWPKNMQELIDYTGGELTEKVFQAPGHPEIANPFLYVRPTPTAPSEQPVLVQDPACNRGKGSMVAYADGHIAYVKGVELWREAQRLAVLPKAAAGGIEPADWTVPTGPAPPAPGK